MMKKSHKKLIAYALSVCAILCLCAMTAAAITMQSRVYNDYTPIANNQKMQNEPNTSDSVPENYCVLNNRAIIQYNAGYVETNYRVQASGSNPGDAAIYTNPRTGRIFANYGFVNYNNAGGLIDQNQRIYNDMINGEKHGSAIPDYLLATVAHNSGEILYNNRGGIVEENAAAGEIDYNQNGAVVEINKGTISQNCGGGLVKKNYGTISTNSGEIYRGRYGTEYNGTVTYNFPAGKVLNCSGIVTHNFGTVEGNSYGAYIENNYTGFQYAPSVTNATVKNQYYEVKYLNQAGTAVSMGDGTDITKTIDGKSYSVKRSSLPINVTQVLVGTYYHDDEDTITIEATDGGCFSVDGGSVRNAENNASGLYTKATITASSLVTVQFYCHTHEESCSGGEHTFLTPLTNAMVSSSRAPILAAGDYYLVEDIAPKDRIMVTGNVSICLNGHVVSGKNLMGMSGVSRETLFYSNLSGGNLAIYDCGTTIHYYTVSADGTWVLNDSSKTNAKNYEELTARPETGDVIAISGGAITGGTGQWIAENPNRFGGGAIFMKGRVTLYGGNLVGNRAHRGGAVYVCTNGSFTMYGGRICGNCAEIDVDSQAMTALGGGVFVYNRDGIYSTEKDGSFALYGGDISFNTAARFGGGVITYGQFNMSGGLISNNYSNLGGGIDLCGGNNDPAIPSALFTGGRIVNNTAKTSGGGVYFWESATPTLGGTIVISGNTSGTTPTADNLYLYQGKTFAIGTGDAAPATGMRVGVTAADPAETVVISKSYATSLIATDFFFSDSDRQLYDLPDTDDANRKLGFSVCRLNTAKTDGSFALSLPIKSDAIIMIAGFDKDGKLTGLAQKKISADTIDGQVTPTFYSADTVRFFLLSESHAPLCEALDATS